MAFSVPGKNMEETSEQNFFRTGTGDGKSYLAVGHSLGHSKATGVKTGNASAQGQATSCDTSTDYWWCICLSRRTHTHTNTYLRTGQSGARVLLYGQSGACAAIYMCCRPSNRCLCTYIRISSLSAGNMSNIRVSNGGLRLAPGFLNTILQPCFMRCAFALLLLFDAIFVV